MQISRHINHTGRLKIKHSEVEIRIIEQPGKAPSFTAAFMLNKEQFPADADLLIEAYHRNTSQRFNFGTVSAAIPPTDTTLHQIDLTGPTLFRVKVVDNSERIGQLIASAERLAPTDDDTEEQKSSLMIFKSMPDMGNLTWRLSFNEARKPVLCINNRIPEAKQQLLHNPYFKSLVLTSAFREVLMYILWDQGTEQDDDGSWQQQWLDFAVSIGQEDCPTEADADILHGWIDDVIRAFSEQHDFCEHLIHHMEDHGNG